MKYYDRYMNDSYEEKKMTISNVAFLGLFAVALLIAAVIVLSRSAIALSGPIKLNHMGLSLAIPSGKGWQTEQKWNYEKNEFTLSSVFMPVGRRAEAVVRCRYILAAAKTTQADRVSQKAAQIKGRVAKRGRAQAGALVFEWVQIVSPAYATRHKDRTPKTPKAFSGLFYGTTELPNSRLLDIEVHCGANDTALAERLFELITENIKFEDNKLLTAGTAIVTEIKSKGLSSFFTSQSRESCFLIQDDSTRDIGFTMDVATVAPPPAEKDERQTMPPDSPESSSTMNIQMAGVFYIRGRAGREQVSVFESDDRFDRINWRSETTSFTARSGTELTVSSGELMSVKKLDQQSEKKNYPLNAATIPDVCLEPLFDVLVQSDYNKIIVDTLEADGTITPTLISKIEAQNQTAEEPLEYTLTMELLNSRGFSQQILLDSKKLISEVFVRQKRSYVLTRTDHETLIKKFPEWADYILKQNPFLEQSPPL